MLRGKHRRTQRIAAARRRDAQPARPAGRRVGQRPPQAGTGRHAAAGCRRARGSRRVPGLRPLADAAFGGRARPCADRRCAKNRSASTSPSRRTSGAPLEVHGRKTAQHVIVRFLSLTETQRGHARLKIENRRLLGDHEMLLGLIDVLKMPFWMRGADGSLKWVNRAYAARSRPNRAEPGAARQQGVPRHAGARRDRPAACSGPVFEQTLSTVIKGDRRMFAVTDFAGAGRLGRHRRRRQRHRGHARGAAAHDPQPRRHARPADHGGGDLRCRPEAALLQPGVPETVGSRARLPRQRARQCAAARPAAQRGQDRRAAGMAALEGEPACRLSLGRPAGGLVAPARRPHHPRRRQSAAEWRRHLGVREPDREDRPGKPLPDRGARAGRDARQSGRGRRGVRSGRPRSPVEPGLLHAVGPRPADSPSPARIFRRSGPPAKTSWPRQSLGGFRRRRHRLRRRTAQSPRPGRAEDRAPCCATPSSICPTGR